MQGIGIITITTASVCVEAEGYAEREYRERWGLNITGATDSLLMCKKNDTPHVPIYY